MFCLLHFRKIEFEPAIAPTHRARLARVAFLRTAAVTRTTTTCPGL